MFPVLYLTVYILYFGGNTAAGEMFLKINKN